MAKNRHPAQAEPHARGQPAVEQVFPRHLAMDDIIKRNPLRSLIIAILIAIFLWLVFANWWRNGAGSRFS
jgi:hypothetical protein